MNLDSTLSGGSTWQEQPGIVDESARALQVLVCNHSGNSVGLVVERILDIVEDAVELKYPATRAGVLYSTVIEERVTEMIDIPAVLEAAGFTAEPPSTARAKSAGAAS